MRRLMSFALVLCAALLAAASLQRDVAADVSVDPPAYVLAPPSTPEPITGSAVMPADSDHAPRRLPSEPYGIGPADQAWKYDQLSAAEKAAVERGRAAGANRQRGQAAVTTAVLEHSMRARAETAQHQLGLDDLDAIGVVP